VKFASKWAHLEPFCFLIQDRQVPMPFPNAPVYFVRDTLVRTPLSPAINSNLRVLGFDCQRPSVHF
jgi:hypothetical protein